MTGAANRRKQRDSIGDEDFYYEETEVDEPTYLAVFGAGGPAGVGVGVGASAGVGAGARARAQATGGAATNVAAGREPALMSPSHNSDGLSSGQSFASSSPATSPVSSSADSSSSSAGSSGGSSLASSSGGYQAGSQLYANSIDWNHFLADHHNHHQQAQQLASSGKLSWLPNQKHHQHLQQQQQQQVYRAAAHLPGEPSARKKRSGPAGHSNKRTYLKSTTNPPYMSEACFLLSPPSSEPESVSVAPVSASASASASASVAASAASKNHQSNSNRNNNGPLQFSMQLTGCSPALMSAAASKSTNGLPPKASGASFRQRQQRDYYHLAKAGFTSPPVSPSPATLASASASASASSSSSAGAANRTSATGAKRGRKPNALKLQQQKLANQAGANSRAASCDASGTNRSGTLTGKQANKESNQTSQQFFHHQSTSSIHRASNDSNLNTYSNNNSQHHHHHQQQQRQQQHYHHRGSLALTGQLINGSGNSNGVSKIACGSSAGSLAGAPLRRGRGENRKCRKVYGMERKDLWCTQCKWKKACSRFCDQ